MTNVLSSSANAALSHDCMSSNVTEWLLQEICFYSVTIMSHNGQKNACFSRVERCVRGTIRRWIAWKWAGDSCPLKCLLQLCAQILQHQQISHPKIELHLLPRMLTENQESEMIQHTILQNSDSDGKVTRSNNNNVKKKNPGTVHFLLRRPRHKSVVFFSLLALMRVRNSSHMCP